MIKNINKATKKKSIFLKKTERRETDPALLSQRFNNFSPKIGQKIESKFIIQKIMQII